MLIDEIPVKVIDTRGNVGQMLRTDRGSELI